MKEEQFRPLDEDLLKYTFYILQPTFVVVVVAVVVQSCLTLCHPMDCSTLGFPVLHHLLEFAQTLVY